MKLRNYAVVAACVLVAAGLAWLFYNSAKLAAPVKSIAAVAPTEVTTPKPAPTQIVAPVVPPAAKPEALAAQPAAPADTGKSQQEIEVHAFIDDVADLLNSGDIIGAMEKTESPEVDAELFPNPEMKARFYESVRKDSANPRSQQQLKGIAQWLQSLKDKTPKMNATGDELTYPNDGVIFEKENGIWYIKRGRGF